GAAGGDASAAAAARADVPANALEGSPESRFAAAMQLLQAGNLAAAEVAFARFERDFPDAPQAPTAAYWVGETFYTRGQYADAAATFARNYRQYGAEAERAPENLLKLGMSLAALGDAEKACASYDELERRFPDAGTAVRQTLERERRSAGCG
ncbi:MAG: tol-pal system protein YbgF, partial [Geminicoccaceae bacterium]|nr:tol-pal system protein YbgF [Geminicoccaceae bacterium]